MHTPAAGFLHLYVCECVCVSIDGMTMCGCLVDYITQFGMCVPECVRVCVCARACMCVCVCVCMHMFHFNYTKSSSISSPNIQTCTYTHYITTSPYPLQLIILLYDVNDEGIVECLLYTLFTYTTNCSQWVTINVNYKQPATNN